MKKKAGRKPLKISDGSKEIGVCYICNKKITGNMLYFDQAVAIGKGKYRCKSKKCEKKVIASLMKQTKVKRKYWLISPVTRVLPNKKKKSRAKIKQDLRREL